MGTMKQGPVQTVVTLTAEGLRPQPAAVGNGASEPSCVLPTDWTLPLPSLPTGAHDTQDQVALWRLRALEEQ